MTDLIYAALALLGLGAGVFFWLGNVISKAERRGANETAQKQAERARENVKIAQENRAKNVSDVGSGKRRRLFESEHDTDER